MGEVVNLSDVRSPEWWCGEAMCLECRVIFPVVAPYPAVESKEALMLCPGCGVRGSIATACQRIDLALYTYHSIDGMPEETIVEEE
tara:strand:- start:603 stop:860 length:258 start_codon:yes stop_codon:yes gene_type:complete